MEGEREFTSNLSASNLTPDKDKEEGRPKGRAHANVKRRLHAGKVGSLHPPRARSDP